MLSGYCLEYCLDNVDILVWNRVHEVQLFFRDCVDVAKMLSR